MTTDVKQLREELEAAIYADDPQAAKERDDVEDGGKPTFAHKRFLGVGILAEAGLKWFRATR